MSKGYSFHEVVEESIIPLHVRVSFSGMEPNSMLVQLAAVLAAQRYLRAHMPTSLLHVKHYSVHTCFLLLFQENKKNRRIPLFEIKIFAIKN